MSAAEPRLEGLSALVTGASRGIGAAVARAFAREGARVVLTARDEAGLRAVADAIEAAGGQATVHAAELTSADARAALARAAGPVDVLVNNAGVLGPLGPVWECPLEAFEQALAVNVTAGFDLVRLLVPGMRQRGRGVVINVSSSVGVAGRAGWGAYSVTKFAVEGLSQTLAADLEGSGVACAVINPGGTRTDMRAEAVPGEDPATLPSPDDITEPFVLLAAARGADHNGVRWNARDFLGG